MSLPHCPKCNSEYTYEDNGMYICPECAYEWNDAEPAQESDELIVKDANGNLLADGAGRDAKLTGGQLQAEQPRRRLKAAQRIQRREFHGYGTSVKKNLIM